MNANARCPVFVNSRCARLTHSFYLLPPNLICRSANLFNPVTFHHPEEISPGAEVNSRLRTA